MALFDGISGWIAAKAMERMNAEAEHEAVARLAPREGSRILAIGFGPGIGLERLLSLPVSEVIGVDPSAVMHRIASARNDEALAQRRLKLIADVVDLIEVEPCYFDGAIAVHTLQICRPFAATANKLGGVLKPGAKLVSITHEWAARKDYGAVESFRTAIEDGLYGAGFSSVSFGVANAEGGTAILIEGIR